MVQKVTHHQASVISSPFSGWEVLSHNGDWGNSFHNDDEMHTGAIWLQKYGMVETVLFSTDQFIYTYICTGVIFGMNKTLTEAPYWIQFCRERMEHTNSTTLFAIGMMNTICTFMQMHTHGHNK